MIRLLDEIDNRANRTHWDAITARLETGEVASVASPAEILATLAIAGLGDPAGPSLTQAKPSRTALKGAASEPALAAMWPHVAPRDLLAMAAGLLQVLDFWDASHEASQEAGDLGETAFSPYWHAIAHRREPDPSNAGYWFRRVGTHPVFGTLGEWVARTHPGVMKGSSWDPMAFVRFCGEAARDPEKERVARSIQRAEMALLLDAQIHALGEP